MDHPKIHPSGMWLDKRVSCHHPKDIKVTLTSKKAKKINACTHFSNSECELRVFIPELAHNQGHK